MRRACEAEEQSKNWVEGVKRERRRERGRTGDKEGRGGWKGGDGRGKERKLCGKRLIDK